MSAAPDRAAARARRTLTDALIRRLVLAWDRLGSWRDADADRFVADAVPQVIAAQRQMGTRIAASVLALARDEAGPLHTIGLTDDQVTSLRGVDLHEVYRRPFVTTYTALSRGKKFPEALARGRTRLGEIAEMDMQQAYAVANRAAMESLPPGARPSHWRRVLVGEADCNLCTLASQNRYRIGDLNPIHPGCDCQVRPVYDGEPGEAFGPDLRAAVRTHGEIGPLLVRPGDHFDGPRQVRT